jgi:hypothetical protein
VRVPAIFTISSVAPSAKRQSTCGEQARATLLDGEQAGIAAQALARTPRCMS